MASQYKAITVTDSDSVDHSMLEVQWPNKVGKVEYVRSYECVICGHDFKKYDVKLIGGRAYCVPNGCYEDVTSKDM